MPYNEIALADLITIRTFSSESEAAIAKSALDAFEIDNVSSADDCGGQRPHLAITGGIRLQVRPEDMERAEQVLTNNGDGSDSLGG